MTGARNELAELRCLLIAFALHCAGTARVKGTTRRRIERTWDVALEQHSETPAPGIGDRNGREQRACVRVVPLVEEIAGAGRFDDLTEVHHRHAVAHVFDDLEIV